MNLIAYLGRVGRRGHGTRIKETPITDLETAKQDLIAAVRRSKGAQGWISEIDGATGKHTPIWMVIWQPGGHYAEIPPVDPDY